MNFPHRLPPQFFWDMGITKLDWDKHQLLIVERVIERRTYENFKYIEQHYGKNIMGNIVKKIP